MKTAKQIAYEVVERAHERLNCDAMDWDGSSFDQEHVAVIQYCFTDDLPQHIALVVKRGVFVDGEPTFTIEFAGRERSDAVFSDAVIDDAVDYLLKQLRKWAYTSSSKLAIANRMIVAIYEMDELKDKLKKIVNYTSSMYTATCEEKDRKKID